MKSYYFLATATAVMLCALSFSTACQAADIDLDNKSTVTIQHLFFAEGDKENWSEDQIDEGAGNYFEPGDTLTVTGIAPGTYKLKAQTATGECLVPNVQLKVEEPFVLSDELLRSCITKN